MVSNLKSILSILAISSFVGASQCSNTSASNCNPTYPNYVHPSNGICTNYTVNTTVSFTASHWAYPPFKNNYDVVAFLETLLDKNKTTFTSFDSNKTVTETYKIAGTFCRPKNVTGNENTVLVATHGIGFDRRYWASSFEPENFSFVQHALTDGYSIFYYDRLGVGLSSRVSGYEIQIAPQVEILACLVKSIRAGQYTDTIKANKIAAIGHSFGSSVSNTLVQKYPKIVDAVVLTGFALANFSDPAAGGATVIPTVFAGRLLPTLQSSSVPQYSDTFDSGYLGFVDQYAFAEAFTHHAVTEQEMKAAQYSFSINQPHSIPELLSLLTVGGDSTDFEGKVVLTAGEFDLVVCAGDCISTFRDGLQDTIYHRTSVTKIIQKGAGHGQNFEPNNVFEEILQGIKGL